MVRDCTYVHMFSGIYLYAPLESCVGSFSAPNCLQKFRRISDDIFKNFIQIVDVPEERLGVPLLRSRQGRGQGEDSQAGQQQQQRDIHGGGATA